MIQNPTLPVQQTAVQQQLQQGQVPVLPRSEYNAIKIDITGATVGTAAPTGVNLPQPALYPEAPGQVLNYTA